MSAVTVWDATTTFVPASSCSSLTMLSSPGFEIWYGEVVPVPTQTATDCYPAGFLAGYTQRGSISSQPLATRLVCPRGWSEIMTTSSSYIACCPSGYGLTPPKVITDSARPALGGTCYSQFTVDSTVSVIAYDTASVTATSGWHASSTGMNAYAHPIDGIKYVDPNAPQTTSASGSGASSSAGLTTSSGPTSSPSASEVPTSQTSLSGGAIAGIVIGVVAALGLLAGALFFMMRRRRQARQQPVADAELPNAELHDGDHKSDFDPTPPYEAATPHNVHEADTTGIHELPTSHDHSTELEGNSPAHEMEGSPAAPLNSDNPHYVSPIEHFDDQKYKPGSAPHSGGDVSPDRP